MPPPQVESLGLPRDDTPVNVIENVGAMFVLVIELTSVNSRRIRWRRENNGKLIYADRRVFTAVPYDWAVSFRMELLDEIERGTDQWDGIGKGAHDMRTNERSEIAAAIRRLREAVG